MAKIFSIIFILFYSLVSSAENGAKILAVVGDDVITYNDMERRFKVIVATNNLQISNDQERQQVSSQVLRALVNEKIFAHEAKRLKIKPTEAEIKKIIANIEKEQNIPAGKFDDFLKSKNIPKEDAISQITNSIIWNKIMEGLIVPQVQVSTKEIMEYADKNMPKDANHLTQAQMNKIREELMDKKVNLQADYYMKNLSKKTYIELFNK